MGYQDLTIRELVDKVERGDIRLPELQRGLVWTATKVRDLLDSLYRGYPSGTILTWETDEPVATRDFAVEQDTGATTQFQLLLDGQQRLTAMSAILRGADVQVRDRRRPIKILFNLEHPAQPTERSELDEDDEAEQAMLDSAPAEDDDTTPDADVQDAFALHTNRLAAIPTWVSVTDVLQASNDAEFIERAGVESLRDPRFAKYTRRLTQLRGIADYSYRVNVLERSKSYEEVTDIFVRVNSLGTKLRSSDLALAQITARWRNSLEVFSSYEQKCMDGGFDLGMGIHLKNLVAFATGQSRFRNVSRLSKDTLTSSWDRATAGMNWALNFLQSNVHISDPILLSSPYVAISLAIYGDQHDFKVTTDEAQQLRTWVLATNTKGRYSGASEGTLDQDIAAIRSGRGADGLLQLLRAQRGRITTEPINLVGATTRSGYYKTIFLACKDAGATGWEDGLNISLHHAGRKHLIQSHHIFPKALLRDQYPNSEVDDIANLAFVGARKNNSIDSTPPSEYLKTIDQAELKKQCIPTDPILWEASEFRQFCEVRRQLLADRINEYIGATE